MRSTTRLGGASNKQRQAAVAFHRARIKAAVQPGETSIAYSHDCAMCSCDPIPVGWTAISHHVGIDVIAVGRNRAAGYDRCLLCGVAWTLREYRWNPATVIATPPQRSGLPLGAQEGPEDQKSTTRGVGGVPCRYGQRSANQDYDIDVTGEP